MSDSGSSRNRRRRRHPTATEVDAYVHIKSELKLLGWDTRNAARVPQGQVYTQNECLSHPEIRARLGTQRPESIVKLSESVFWVIEAKRTRLEITRALTEARQYATEINMSPTLKARLISGVAGNEADGYTIRTQFLEPGGFQPVTLNNQEITGFVSPEIARRLIDSGTARLQDIPIDQRVFLAKAERINEILHEGAIPINNRARTISAILLAFLDDTPPNLNAAPSVLIGDINTRVQRVLRRQGKPDFYEYIKLSLPTTETNHMKYRKALVETWNELESLSIRTAMNSGTDVLGQFYEVFLKYGKGAKEMGIVLTPRHITRFAAEALGVRRQDVIFDPTVGTAGFLVAAFDSIKANSTHEQIEEFKQNNVFGIDQDPEVVSLAIVNMIFRGDGKNNIIEANCFAKTLVRDTRNGQPTAKVIDAEKRKSTDQNAVTRVLMNPSFKQEATDEPEYKFVNYALNQMVDGELLFSVLPISAMFEQGEERDWRENQLLTRNTLLATVTLPPELFYPTVSVHSLGIFVRKGTPHPRGQNVLWMRAVHDGHRKIKKKRLLVHGEPDDLPTILPVLRSFLQDTNSRVENRSQLMKTAPIDFTDPLLELVPESYLDPSGASPEDIRMGMENLMKETLAHLMKIRPLAEVTTP